MENSSDRLRRGWLGAILLFVMAVSSTCASPSARPSPSPSPSPTATASPPLACADRVFAAMTSDQRIGQLFELGLADDRLGPTEINLIQTDHIGSVWFVATSTAGVAGIQAVTSAVQAQVSSRATANVRFFIAANQEGGVIQAMQGPGFSRIPAAVVQGTSTPAALQRQATPWGQELRAAGNTDSTTATDTTTTGSDPYLQSFKDGIAANADFVMVALARYTQIDPNHLAAFSSVVMTEMLRNSLGFGGVIISDDLGATAAVANIPPATRAIDFLSAGGDMIISKTSAPADAMVQAIRAQVAKNASFRQRVDDAALRVLKAKQAFGLLPC